MKEKLLTIQEAFDSLERMANEKKNFLEMWNEKYPNTPFEEAPLNKGSLGQVVERLLGMNLSSRLKDFEDGKLKPVEHS